MQPTVSELLGADHESLADLLRELHSALAKSDPARAFELLDLFWARLAMHIRAENVCLFPAIRKAIASRHPAGSPTIAEAESAIETLKSDHNFFMDQLAHAVKIMRELPSGGEKSTQLADRFDAVRNRVTAVTARQVAHNDLEEEQVYRWPALILSRPELERLRVAIDAELENMPPRFALVH